MYSGTFFISGPETFSSLFYPNLFVLTFSKLTFPALQEVSYIDFFHRLPNGFYEVPAPI